jgi:Ricin-type beta-trefoil lectin domain-like/Right handed beta helix region
MSKVSLLFIGFVAMQTAATAAIVDVPAGGDLQAALNAAHSGDTINLAAGATYTGNFRLAPNAGPAWITIQSSAMNSLPGAGVRVSPDQAGAMARIITPNAASAVQITTGANYYRFVGIEFSVAPGIYIQDVIQAGMGYEPSTDQLPHDLDFDRDYIHPDASAGGKRGIALNGGSTTVENSYVSGFWSTGQDTQALAGWNGPGPFTITNNYLEAGTEIIAFGGAIPSISGVVPSNILIQGNRFYKPLSWMPGNPSYAGIPVMVKNDIEVKNGQNITIDNNTFENNWKGADQRGYFLLFNVRTELGWVPWAVVNNVKVTNNIFRHSSSGIDITGHDDDGSGSASNFLVQNNVWDDISSNWGSDGRWFQATTGANNVTIDHNTVFQTGFILIFDVGQEYNVNATNNIVLRGGEIAGNGAGLGISALISYDLGGVFSNNVLVGASAGLYPSGNFFPSSIDQVGFVNYAGGDYRLADNSPYKNAGTDSKDLGANLSSAPAAPVTAPASPISVAPASPDPPSNSASAGSAALNIPSSWMTIISKSSGKCLDVSGISTAALALMQQWACWGGDNQTFRFSPVTGGYEITARNSGLQLDVLGQSTDDGGSIIQYPFWGGANEIWQVTPTSDGYFSLTPINSGKCMNVTESSGADGALMEQRTCSGIDSQKWSLTAI